jgi:antitoxin component HigA of HigAB toxin-antitoxin module
MAVVNCSECSGAVSQAAAACPHCGHPRTPLGAHVSSSDAGLGAAAGSALRFGGKALRAVFLIAGTLVVVLLLVKLLNQHATPPRPPKPPPQTLLDDRFELQEGQYRSLSFHLPQPREIELSMDAAQKPVNVYLLTADQWGQFTQNEASIFGSGFNYTKALSQRRTMKLERTATLPEGDWHLTVERPKESIIFKEPAVVTIKVEAK